MATRLKKGDEPARRAAVLRAARWCFLHFGYAKTSLEDIARRADLSRTLLYRMFRDKDDLFVAVFEDWLAAHHPAAEEVAAGKGKGSKRRRLLEVCELLLLEPWAEMAGAPMAAEFHAVCARLDPGVEQRHRDVFRRSVRTILQEDDEA
ncbi:MAG: helix-turn-helix transcriptional regulator, partial [Acidobacteria bacterium]|nr:helix-turn-helix transcriptional regulator [Acidobacteriota bacterium]